jgi:small subunit ribosomal protein S16
VLGSYDARSTAGQPRPVQLKAERVKHWLDHGAQVSGTVHNLLVDQKIISGKKINVLPRKSVPAKAEAVPVEAAPEASAASAETPATV